MKYIIALGFLCASFSIKAQDSSSSKNTEVIYGRKDGMALTMLMQKPASPNGKAVVSVVSGNWRSGYDLMQRFAEKDRLYLEAGYTVFNVIHSSQPKYSIPEIVEDVKRAVRYIRYNAKNYGINSNQIGITGASSGGHVALMVATTGDNGDKGSRDPVDNVSSGVQACAVFFPPTDFLNYGQNGFNASASQVILRQTGLSAAFDFKRWNDTTRTYVSISDVDAKKEIARQMSPSNFVSPDDPPTIIIHGDADRLVPLQQSELIIKKFEEAKVANKLIVKSGAGHTWRNSEVDEKNFVSWFDQYLK